MKKNIKFPINTTPDQIITKIEQYKNLKYDCLFDLSLTNSSSSALSAIINSYHNKKNYSFILNDLLRNDLVEFKQLIDFDIQEETKVSHLTRLVHKINILDKKFISFIILAADCFHYSILGIFNSKSRRKGSIFEQTYLMGYNSVPIIFLLSLLIGLILSIQSAQQLKQFGANIFLVDLIVISMISEMGPMMTAIIIAGRNGSSIAAEIATMKITEELDALEVMAINPLKYIVTPKFIAMTITLPILTVIANITGIFGGFLIAVMYLDLSPNIFISRSFEVMTAYMWFQSLLKSVLFSWVIVFIAVHYGTNVSGGSEGVGKATTASVVASIFSVIVLDAILSLIFYFKF